MFDNLAIGLLNTGCWFDMRKQMLRSESWRRLVLPLLVWRHLACRVYAFHARIDCWHGFVKPLVPPVTRSYKTVRPSVQSHSSENPTNPPSSTTSRFEYPNKAFPF